jgi:hypothetical protein
MQDFFDKDRVDVGDCHAIAGTQDGILYNLWRMKEPDYVMRMMTTGGLMTTFESCKESVRWWIDRGVKVVCRFCYACPFDWHFRYRHAVDDHNNLWHGFPLFEDSWNTMRWENCVFLFVLAITEVNAFLALWYFSFAKGTILGFLTLLVLCRQLAWQLIKNPWIANEEAAGVEEIGNVTNTLLTAPPHAKRYRNCRWDTSAKSTWQKFKCTKGCKRWIRTFCACTTGM